MYASATVRRPVCCWSEMFVVFGEGKGLRDVWASRRWTAGRLVLCLCGCARPGTRSHDEGTERASLGSNWADSGGQLQEGTICLFFTRKNVKINFITNLSVITVSWIFFFANSFMDEGERVVRLFTDPASHVFSSMCYDYLLDHSLTVPFQTFSLSD